MPAHRPRPADRGVGLFGCPFGASSFVATESVEGCDAHLRLIARRRGRPDDTKEQQIRRGEARRLALAIREATAALAANKKQLAELVATFAPGLLDKLGVGPVSAAQAIVSYSHPGRCRNDATFAALAGVSPLQASSGRTVRHRLNRGGDRQLTERCTTS